MTREDIRDLVASALVKMKDGKDTNEAIIEVLKGRKVTDEQIKRVIETTNHSFMNAVYKNKTDKEFAFDVATFDKVKKGIEGKVEKKEEPSDNKKVATLVGSNPDKAFELRLVKAAKADNFPEVISAGLSERLPLFALLVDDVNEKIASIANVKYEYLKEAEVLEEMFEKSKISGIISEAIEKDKGIIKKIRESFKKTAFINEALSMAVPAAASTLNNAGHFAASIPTGVAHGISAVSGVPFNERMLGNMGLRAYLQSQFFGGGPKINHNLSPMQNAGASFNKNYKEFVGSLLTGRGGVDQR